MKKIHEGVRSLILNFIDLFYPLFKRIFSLQTFRYAACGGINTFLDIGLFSFNYNIVFKKHDVYLGFVTLSPHIAAMFLSFCVTLPVGFYLNRYIVFQQSGLRRHDQLMRYIAVIIMCVALNYIMLKIFVEQLHWYPTPSKMVTTFVVIVFSYVSQTFFFFRSRRPLSPTFYRSLL